MQDKRIRQLVIAVLVVLLVLGLLSLVSTVFQMFVPLAILAAVALAFYKIVLQGRDSSTTMEDEIAESSGMAADDVMADADKEADSSGDMTAQERLSAVEQAKSEYLDTSTTAEEILDQIKARRQRLQGDDPQGQS